MGDEELLVNAMRKLMNSGGWIDLEGGCVDTHLSLTDEEIAACRRLQIDDDPEPKITR